MRPQLTNLRCNLNKYVSFLIVAPLVCGLASCGGSGSGSGSPFGSDADEITAENFAEVASGFYNQIQIQVLGMQLLPQVDLFYLQFPVSSTDPVDCGVSGSTLVTVTGSAGNAEVNAGDSVRVEHRDCRGSFSTKDGFSELSVVSLTGEYDSDSGFTATMRWRSEIETSGDSVDNNNGMSEFDFEWLTAGTDGSDYYYSASNLGALYDSGTDVPVEHPFREFALGSMASPLVANPLISYTSVSYPELGFELITDNGSTDQVLTYRWSLEAEFTDSDYVDFLSYTVEPLDITVDGSGEPAAEGSWRIEMATGEHMLIESTFSGGTTISLDFEGDGDFEHTETMSWPEFTGLFLSSVFQLPLGS